jgi:aspartate 1-decarboxylase
MQRILLKSKLHRVRVTRTALHYVGSIGIDEALMEAANLLPYEKVVVADIDNGARFETYVVPEERGSGTIAVLGAAARLVHQGDLLIILAFGMFDEREVAAHKPAIVFVDERNQRVQPGA